MQKSDIYEIAIKVLSLYLVVVVVGHLSEVLMYASFLLQSRNNVSGSDVNHGHLFFISVFSFLIAFLFAGILMFRTEKVASLLSGATVSFRRFPFWRLYLQVSFILVLLGGCKSYNVVPNGFIIQGDDNFVSVEEKFSVTIGSILLNKEIWKKNSPPLHASTPTSEQKRILRELGYDKINYAVVFTTSKNLPFQIVGLVNSFPLSSKTKTNFVEIGKLNRKETDYAKWYEETLEINSHQVYHAIVPISEKLFAEKYLSIIYMGASQQSDFELIKEIVRTNAEKYRRIGQQYLPMKTMETCPGEGEAKYFDYAVPEVVIEYNQYTLLKVFSEKDETNVVYYTLLQPGQSLGSFKLCRGRYLIEYTSLDGVVLWNENTEIK